MPLCLFVSDLHGHLERYARLWALIARERPAAVFFGGDLLPGWPGADPPAAAGGFVADHLAAPLAELRAALGPDFPRVFLILGNDDRGSDEADILAGERGGLWEYAHLRRRAWTEWSVWGYACVPPTPFLGKDWERYDVSRHVEPGCVPPEEGFRSVSVARHVIEHATIQADLEALTGAHDLARAIMLFHAPPYDTVLDRAALDGRMIDHVPLDLHVGSIAIRRFIEQRQPLITLHGHIHESARLTGAWKQQIGCTWCCSAAHDGPELAVVRFDPADPAGATRTLM